jgi:hypothetical protein
MNCEEFRRMSSRPQPLVIASRVVKECVQHAISCLWCQEWLMAHGYYLEMDKEHQRRLKRLIYQNEARYGRDDDTAEW